MGPFDDDDLELSGCVRYLVWLAAGLLAAAGMWKVPAWRRSVAKR